MQVLLEHLFFFSNNAVCPCRQRAFYPLTLPVVSPATKNFWQKIKTNRIGSKLKTDKANTYPHCVNWCCPKKPDMAIGMVLFRLSLITVLAHGNSSHAVRKLKIDTDAIPGLANGMMIFTNTVNTLPPSI